MQMKMFLTRLGEGSKMVVTGDPSQIDLPHGQRPAWRKPSRCWPASTASRPSASRRADVVRRDLVARIVDAYDKAK